MQPRVRLDLSVEEARGRLTQHLTPKRSRTLPITSLAGLVLAEDVAAPFEIPRFTNSAMDGFAVRAAETRAASEAIPVRLVVLGSLEAGEVWARSTEPASAVRISTGAAIPNGYDAVIPAEFVESVDDTILVIEPVSPGQHVRPIGEDIQEGALAVPAGSYVRAQEIGLLAALGFETALAIEAPTISVLSIGPELLTTGKPAPVPDVNGPMLAAQAVRARGTVNRVARSSGDRSALGDQLEALSSESDLVIASGGISDSRADTMAALLASNRQAELWNVRLRPGKHFGVGLFDHATVLALPGNPVAAYIGFELFGRLAIDLIAGRPINTDRFIARAVDPFDGAPGRTDAIRAHVSVDAGGQLCVSPTRRRGSGIVSSLLEANCLALLPESVERVEVGDVVEIRWAGSQ